MGLLSIFTGSAVRRALDLIDAVMKDGAEKEAAKASAIAAHMNTRAGWLRAGGFITLMVFALPVAFWFGSIAVYSVFWCADCAYPQAWSIAALPDPLNEWAGLIISACCGGGAFLAWRGR